MQINIIKISEIIPWITDLLEGTYTLRILESFAGIFIKIAPYLAISILLQVTLVYIFKRKNFAFKAGNPYLMVIFGALLGLVSPLPSFAAVPIGLAFVPMGIPISAVLAFSIASPLINPGVFFLTITQLGVDIAVARIIAALLIAVSGGLLMGKILSFSEIQKGLPEVKLNPRPFFTELWRSILFFGKYFTIAILISAVVKALISPEFVTEILGQHVQRSLLIAIALGVPFYSCGGAAIPFMEVLSDMGMNQGAVLAFFIAGPATKLETLYVYKSILGLKYLVLFLIITLAGAYASGLLFMLLG